MCNWHTQVLENNCKCATDVYCFCCRVCWELVVFREIGAAHMKLKGWPGLGICYTSGYQDTVWPVTQCYCQVMVGCSNFVTVTFRLKSTFLLQQVTMDITSQMLYVQCCDDDTRHRTDQGRYTWVCRKICGCRMERKVDRKAGRGSALSKLVVNVISQKLFNTVNFLKAVF